MVIAALELDGTQIGDDHGVIVGVGGNDIRRHPAVLIQPHEDADGGLADKAGDLVQIIHDAGGGVDLLAAALRHLLADVRVNVLQRVVLPAVQHRQRLGALVGELLFHHERSGHLVALVEIAVDDEAVQLGPQGDGLQQRRHHQMEHGVGELRLRLILLRQIGVHGGQIDALGDIRLVVAAVGIDDAGDKVQGIQLPQQAAVLAVAPALFLCFHFFLLSDISNIFVVFLQAYLIFHIR